MTSVRKLVSRGAKDSKTGIWWITVSLAPVPREFFNSRHLLCSLQSAEPQSAAWLVSKKSSRHFRHSVTHPVVHFSLAHRGPGNKVCMQSTSSWSGAFLKVLLFCLSSISVLKISSHPPPPKKMVDKMEWREGTGDRDVKGCYEFLAHSSAKHWPFECKTAALGPQTSLATLQGLATRSLLYLTLVESLLLK